MKHNEKLWPMNLHNPWIEGDNLNDQMTGHSRRRNMKDEGSEWSFCLRGQYVGHCYS